MSLQSIYRVCLRSRHLSTSFKLGQWSMFERPPPVNFQNPSLSIQPISTEAFNLNPQDGYIRSTLKKMRLYLRKYRLHAAGFKLYESVADQIDHSAFMDKLEMPDTFNSWFMLTELHVWMLMARLMANPYEGRTLRNYVVEALWKDVTTRAKKLGSEHASVVRTQIYELNEGFQAALVLYDEGLLGNDKILAGALWRRFFNQKCNSAHHLEAMVCYVRHTMQKLDQIELEDLINGKKVNWTPIGQIIDELQKQR